MAFYNEFPHTRNYDDDLRELICTYENLLKEYSDLIDIYQKILKNLSEIAINYLQQLLKDGQLTIDLNYNQQTESLNFTIGTSEEG